MKGNFLKQPNKNREGGYIIVFTLILMSVIMFLSLSIAKLVEREVLFSRMAANSREAYFAADSGMDCAQYIDSVYRDDTKSISLFLNAIFTTAPKTEFENNARDNVFFATSSVVTELGVNMANYKSSIFCSSNGSYNRVFNEVAPDIGFVATRAQVVANLNSATPKASYSIVGNASGATTTIGIVLKEGTTYNNLPIERCAIIDFYRQPSPGLGPTVALKYTITVTGYSSCKLNNINTISRTIQQFSSN